MSDYTAKCKNSLPIIFDDNMPLANLTPKIVKRVNNNTEDLKNLYGETEALQEDVEGKVDAPSTAGTAGQVLTSDGEGGTAWANVGTGEIVVDPTLTIQGAAADAKKAGDEISQLKTDISELENSYVEESESDAESVTLTNSENSRAFYDHGSYSNGFTGNAFSDGVVTYTGGKGTEQSPYVLYIKSWGTKKWICGFKYKITKLDPNLGDPEKVRVHLGTTAYDDPISWGQWVDFAETATLDLTRIRIAVANFATAPATNTFTLEIKDLYLYDATDVSAEMCNYIMQQQSADYQDGTVTYGTPSTTTYVPDTSLAVAKKVADSKAVGDAIENLRNTTNKKIAEGIAPTTQTISASVTNAVSLSNMAAYSGLTKTSATNLATYTPSSSPSTSPAIRDYCDLSNKKWMVGFKYKLTKLDSSLGDPEYIKVYFGKKGDTNYSISYPVVYDEWVEIAEIADVTLNRVYMILANYATAPTAGQMKLEVKDYYVYDISSLDSDLVAYIQNKQSTDYADGTVTYSIKTFSNSLRNSIVINVKDYGVMGDGITDDTTAIRTLFATKHGRFYFPAGEYKISGTLSIPAGSEMYGDGDTTIINMYSNDTLIPYVFRNTELSYPYIYTDQDNVRIHKLKIIGNNSLQTERHVGIGICDAKNVIVSDATVYNINYDPNRDEGDPSPVVSAYGIDVHRSENVTIERCYVEQCGYECIGISDYSKHCVVRDCVTKNGWRTCIQVHRGVKDIVIDNCYMMQTHEKYDACFTLHGLSGDDLVENLRVENCTAIMTVTSVTGQQYDYCAPLQFMSYCNGLWCVNNKVTGGKRALYSASTVENLKIIGNQLDCNSSSDYGLKMLSENAILIGNTVVNAASSGNTIDATAVLVGNIGIS